MSPHLTEPSTTRLEEVSSHRPHWWRGNGFEPSVPRVMDGDLGRQVPALIAVFELAGTAVALQRGTKVVWPHRHPEFP